jgi:SPW repeat
MATPLSRRPEPGDQSPQAVPAGSAAGEYLLPATRRDVAAQAGATLGILTGLWVALSPLFITLQHGGSNANIADLIAGLAVAAFGAVAVASRRGFGSLEFGSLVLGVWVIVSSFILDAKFTIAAPMFWSNTFAGAVLVLLGLAGLATAGRATR